MTSVPWAGERSRSRWRCGLGRVWRWGWLAVGAAVVGFGSWVVLPIVTSMLGERYPVTDTFVMPLIGLALTVIAAVINVLAVWRGGQRSGVSIVAAALTVAAVLFLGVVVIGEGLGGA